MPHPGPLPSSLPVLPSLLFTPLLWLIHRPEGSFRANPSRKPFPTTGHPGQARLELLAVLQEAATQCLWAQQCHAAVFTCSPHGVLMCD